MHLHAVVSPLLGALTWDPQIRGALIVLTAFLILPGSVYLLLATNTGSRLGFLLAVAGLSGWLAIMGVVWMVFGIGLKGREPSWKPKELIVGSIAGRSTLEPMRTFPDTGWKKLDEGDAELGDASSAADRILVPTASAGGHGAEAKEPSPEQQARFKSPFNATSAYTRVAGYDRNEAKPAFTIRHHKFYGLGKPHYAVIQVQAVIPDCKADQVSTSVEPCLTPPGPGEPANAPKANPNAPVVTLIMVRDRGSVRFPPFLIAVASLLVFGVTCSALHERDKEIMRARGQIPATA
jgi:hypothetical protein